MAKKTSYRIDGRVVNTTGTGLTGLLVEAWDKDLLFDDLVGSAVTGKDGKFGISFTAAHFKELFGDRTPDLFFKVFRDGKLIVSTEETLVWSVGTGKTEIIIELDLPADGSTEEPQGEQDDFAVRGKVEDSGGHLVGSVSIEAVHRELREEISLGKGETDSAGEYRITWQWPRSERKNLNLTLKMLDDSGDVLHTTPTNHNVLRDQRVDVKLERPYPDWSEFERLVRTIQPLLGNDLGFAQLELEDVTFLAGKTGLDASAIERLVLAHHLLEQSGIAPQFWYAVLHLPFYKITGEESLGARKEIVQSAVRSLDERTARKGVTGAVAGRKIDGVDEPQMEKWLNEFKDFILTQILSEHDPAGATFTAQVLKDAGIDDDDRSKRFAALIKEYRDFTPEVAEALKEDKGFSDEEAADLETSYRLANIVLGDFSTVAAIKSGFGVRRPEEIPLLAKRTEEEWSAVVSKNLAPEASPLPIAPIASLTSNEGGVDQGAVFGHYLADQFKTLFPTVAFAGGLERALSGDVSNAFEHGEEFAQFLGTNPEFELHRTNIDLFFDEKNSSERVAAPEAEAFKTELKAAQRVFKLAPDYDAVETLMADKVHSARQVYLMGESEFVRKYKEKPGFNKKKAHEAWQRAADTHAATVSLVAEMKALEYAGDIAALNAGNEAVSNFPNWNNLFKTGDLCGCDHCRSVYSPAAYFADLLMFLKERRSADNTTTVKEILFKRRPDLGYLELNCENANVEIPYIDVVCEVLEAAIANGENDRELVGFTAIDPDPVQAEADVRAALSIAADRTLSLSRVGAADIWVVHTEAITWLLKKKGGANYFSEILRNTKASSAELRAFPQYVNQKAYDKLKEAQYPFGLPFDLNGETVRAAFKKAGLKRWDLMETLHGSAAPNNASEVEIAAEYFNISVDPAANPIDEMRIILNADTTTGHEYWGEGSNADMLAEVKNVRTFLNRTGLEYNQLLALLDLEFVNPGGALQIHHLDASCDTDQKEIQTLDEAALDRIHRFLRLWRKTGWEMWELDLAIRHPNVGADAIDDQALVRLMHLSRLKEKLGNVSIEQTLTLFGDMNTTTRFTKLHEKRADALYQSLFLNPKLIHPLDPDFAVDLVDVPVSAEPLNTHLPAVMAALRLKEVDLTIFAGLTKASDGNLYLTNQLTLANLSFLYRHSWLAKLLKFKADEWKTLLKLYDQDLPGFTDPKDAIEFIEMCEEVQKSGFNIDELNWVLSADPTAKGAVKETDAARFLFGLRKELKAIADEYDPNGYDFLQPASTDVEGQSGLLTLLLQQLNRSEKEIGDIIATFRNTVVVEVPVSLPGFVFPPAILAAINVNYNEPAGIMRFTGLMTSAEKTTLDGVSAVPAYRAAIQSLFDIPRLAMKFYQRNFSTALAVLPSTIDFNAQLSAELAAKVSFDNEGKLLRFGGIMSDVEKSALEGLSTDAAYRAAVGTLYSLPRTGLFPPESIWLRDADLTTPLNAANLPTNLKIAATKLLAWLKKTKSEMTVLTHFSAGLALPTAVVRYLSENYQLLLPGDNATILRHFTGSFATSGGVIDYAGFKNTFDQWYWLNRVGLVLTRKALGLRELKWLHGLHTPTSTLDFATLPLDSTKPIASLDNLLRTSRLLRLRGNWSGEAIDLLDVLERLHGGLYPAAADFAVDVALLTGWSADEVEKLVLALDITYPGDYLPAESWERFVRAVGFLEKLATGTDVAKTFAAATMGEGHASTINLLLHAKYGPETWLTLSQEIQDVLRGRKRDALAAYLLAQAAPSDAPSGKWENTNDLYAYYLLDIEMSSCMTTSRLVQASGSVQLFVQRAFMGLEPEIEVKADGDEGDSAWRWWKWMRKYRVWEANRKVFLYPENWIEPELRRDKSSFFKDLENELLQNEVNQETVENAYLNYLEKLDGVARLEIAAFYHEDDADRSIIHVFGRTYGAEPHLYYYRQFDYRRWTPWEKIDLDISGNYLIPTVINKRLFLFWPVFTEVPQESDNRAQKTPDANSDVKLQETIKKLRMQMAVSEFRNGKWKPKKISKEFVESSMGTAYVGELRKKHYEFWIVDRSEIDGRFGIKFYGRSEGTYFWNGNYYAGNVALLQGSFAVAGCKGVPEIANMPGSPEIVVYPDQSDTQYMKYVEKSSRYDAPQDDFSLWESYSTSHGGGPLAVLDRTPDLFRATFSGNPSWIDKLLMDIPNALNFEGEFPIGTWQPYFYEDRHKTFLAFPMLDLTLQNQRLFSYYPEVKGLFKWLRDLLEGIIRQGMQGFDPDALAPADRANLEAYLTNYFEVSPPLTGPQIFELVVRTFMQYVNYYLGQGATLLYAFRKFHFRTYYHPFVCDFAKLVYNPLKGIPALMSRETQLKTSSFNFKYTYKPTSWVLEDTSETYYPKEDVDFTPDGSYSPYNWELFFHTPLMIAMRLSKNQRFEEAMQWFHYIFNPIGVEGTLPDGTAAAAPQKYWITKPFFLTTDDQYAQQRIDAIMRIIAGDATVDGYTAQLRTDLEGQVRDWRDNPFEPHRIAQYRTVAYQKTVLMKYIDNLIEWGDYLFRQDSMESINEATQLYIMAAEILGPRPRKIPPRVVPPVESFNELEEDFDRFSNALIQVENLVPMMPGNEEEGEEPAPIPTLYFCIPHNEKMLGYWDKVADRLYKIRHCMNIEGVVRKLSLFEPEIDPGALVKAVAGGMDLSSALADLNAPLPFYRFNVLMQKANELCNDVKGLGASLLSALEKKDAEELSLLRQGQEIKVLEAALQVRRMQIIEANESLEALRKSKELAEFRRDYYAAKEFMNAGEIAATVLQSASLISHGAGVVADVLAGVMFVIPDFHIGASGFGGSPHFAAKTGGTNVGKATERGANGLYQLATILDKSASIANTLAGYQRRKEDWDFQRDLASREIIQIEKQLRAAEEKVRIAEQEERNQVLAIDNARRTNEFLQSKYTNKELYQWMVGQISQVYFQSYQLAYDLAKRAERCFRFELGVRESSYINFGYWDSLKKGLLAGEKLGYDLRRLDSAYLDRNKRELELTKNVSLALLDPVALIQLKETGRCFLNLPEEIFDLDYPGHYFRRIKSVSISLPCVAGPYTTISCSLRLLKNHIRINTDMTNGYAHLQEDGIWTDDPRFVQSNIPVKSIAASTAQNDSGMFELTFRDERYLPFEGAGVISDWSLELFNDSDADFGKPLRQFDYSTISDVILHVKYTSREDAGPFKHAAVTHLREHFSQADAAPAVRAFSLRNDFPNEWYRFLHPENPANGNVLELTLDSRHFPFRDSTHGIKVNALAVIARCEEAGDYEVTFVPPLAAPVPPAMSNLTLTPLAKYGNLHAHERDTTGDSISIDFDNPVVWNLEMTSPTNMPLRADEVDDVVIVLGYEWEA